ncbi:DUF3828 domain-containing protein [Phreatobacter sp.]|uniref:DUF3828 domain-containing protein n=1 Tax=Phreatobacter sp. TaxID=1966341 RepID=UPI0022CA029D|nr:DUF3828 domain-containing protein [Phreatobacter sp.]MCZ8316661.1 DUF3828 domain-containing protein [Phreatobacter sp.]
MTLLTRRTLVVAALAAATPALAQQAAPPADPVAALRAFYAKPGRASVNPFLTPRLRRLYTEQQARSRRSGDVMPGLDFGFACGCQDSDDNYHTRNVYRVVSRDERRAKVAVTVKVFATEAETRTITFDLALENGRWLIDDVAGSDEPAWVLSQLLQMRD